MNPLWMNRSIITYTPINESIVDEQVPERSIFILRVSSSLSSMTGKPLYCVVAQQESPCQVQSRQMPAPCPWHFLRI